DDHSVGQGRQGGGWLDNESTRAALITRIASGDVEADVRVRPGVTVDVENGLPQRAGAAVVGVGHLEVRRREMNRVWVRGNGRARGGGNAERAGADVGDGEGAQGSVGG